MGKKLYRTDTLVQAQQILAALDHIQPAPPAFSPIVEALSADVARVKALHEKIAQLQNELLNARNERDATCLAVWDRVKRARAAVKSFYGDDSTEYQLTGGTRLSERKPPRRKVSAPTHQSP